MNPPTLVGLAFPEAVRLPRSITICAYRVRASILQNLPITLVTGRRDYVTQNLDGAFHRAYPIADGFGRRRDDFRDRFTEAGNENRLLGFLYLVDQGQAFGLEFGNCN